MDRLQQVETALAKLEQDKNVQLFKRLEVVKSKLETASRSSKSADRYDSMASVHAKHKKLLPKLVKQLKAAGIPVMDFAVGNSDEDSEINLWRSGMDRFNIQLSSGTVAHYSFTRVHWGPRSKYMRILKSADSLESLIPAIKNKLVSMKKESIA